MLTCERIIVHCHINQLFILKMDLEGGEMEEAIKMFNVGNYHYYYWKGSIAYDNSESRI